MKTLKRVARVLLSLAGTALLLWVLFSVVDTQALLPLFILADKELLTIGVGFLFAGHIFTILRWKKILELMGYPMKYSKVARAYMANLPITKLTPTYSGDFLRAMQLKEDVPLSKGAGGVFLEALLDIFVLALSVFVGALVLKLNVPLFLSACIILGFIVAGYVLDTPFATKYLHRHRLILNFFEAISIVSRKPLAVLLPVLYTFIAWMGTVLFLWCAFRALGEHLELSVVFLLQPLAVLAGLLPVTLSGVGVRESAMMILYAPHASAEIILATGLLYSIFTVVVFPLFCVPWTFASLQKLSRKTLD